MQTNSLLDEIWMTVYGFTLLFVFILIIGAIISNPGFPNPGDPLYSASVSLKESIAASIILLSLLLGGGSWIINELTGNGRR